MEGHPSGTRPRTPVITTTAKGMVARRSGDLPRITPRATVGRRGGSLPGPKATEGRRSGGRESSEMKQLLDEDLDLYSEPRNETGVSWRDPRWIFC